jgi:cytochrome c556
MRKHLFSLVRLIAVVAVAFVFDGNPAQAQAQQGQRGQGGQQEGQRGQGQRGGQQEALPALVNIKVLTNMTPAQVRDQMNTIRDQLGARCRYCHFFNEKTGVTDYIPETPMKQVGRQMIQMVRVLNEQEPFKSGPVKASCATCHKGSPHIPVFVPGGRETWVPPEVPAK